MRQDSQVERERLGHLNLRQYATLEQMELCQEEVHLLRQVLKVGGLIVDRREVLHGKVDQMSRDEVERRLADLLGKQAIEHKSGVELPLKSGSENIEVGEIVEEEVVKKKSGRARPIPKEKVEED